MKTLKDFMIDQLKELRNAAIQLKIIVDKMAYQTSNEDLRHAFEVLSKENEKSLSTLSRIFSLLGVQEDSERYAYMIEGLGKEVQAFTDQNPQAEIRDAGFIALVQKAKHYEISLYGTLREYAHELDNVEAHNLLTELLQEEKANDRELTEKARTGINQRAADTAKLPKRFASTGR